MSSLFFYVDIEPPSKISCPKSKVVTISSGNQIAVYWEPVLFTDNCGNENLIIQQSAQNNSMFGKGNHGITYTAIDKARNVARCQFSVRVQGMRYAS